MKAVLVVKWSKSIIFLKNEIENRGLHNMGKHCIVKDVLLLIVLYFNIGLLGYNVKFISYYGLYLKKK